MNENFDILFFLQGVIISLSVTRILEFVGKIIAAAPRDSRFRDSFHIFWLIALLFYLVQYWYFTIKWKAEMCDISFSKYCLSLAIPLLLFGMATVISPDEQEIKDLHPNTYFEQRAWLMFAFVGCSLIMSVIENLFIQDGRFLSYPSENGARAIFGVVFLWVGFYRKTHIENEWVPASILLTAVLFRVLMAFHPI